MQRSPRPRCGTIQDRAGAGPARDIVAQEQGFVRARPFSRCRLGIDATWKEGYPPVVTMLEETKKLVDRRWGEYGLS